MRTVGDSDKIVTLVLNGDGAVSDLILAVQTGDKYMRALAMDALQKIAIKKIKLVEPYKKDLLTYIADSDQQEVQWHVVQIVPLLNLSPKEQQQAFKICTAYMASSSNIVKTWSLNAIVALAKINKRYQKTAGQLLNNALATGSPAMKARARNLIGKG